MRIRIEVDGDHYEIHLRREAAQITAECEGESATHRPHTLPPGVELLAPDAARIDGRPMAFQLHEYEPGTDADPTGHATTNVHALMHGRLVRILVQPGQQISRGQPLFVLEAMKMQNELLSPASGRVREVLANAGDVVETGRVLCRLER